MNFIIYENECFECGRKNLEKSGVLTYRRDDGDLILVCRECYESNEETYGLIYLEWE